jgi:hypothetical protein
VRPLQPSSLYQASPGRLPPSTPCPPRCQVDAALRTALALRAYGDVLEPAELWSFVALAAFYARFFGTCSKARHPPAAVSCPHCILQPAHSRVLRPRQWQRTQAPSQPQPPSPDPPVRCALPRCPQAFVKLESLPAIPEARRAAYADVALSVFTANAPADPVTLKEAGAGAGPGGAAAAGGGGRHAALLGDLEGSARDQVRRPGAGVAGPRGAGRGRLRRPLHLEVAWAGGMAISRRAG